MNLKQVGSNMTELDLGNKVILFSYSTPVASTDGIRYWKTEKKWSATTTRHINKWVNGAIVTSMPQEYFDNLIKEVA